jgi:hypothetical protein
MEHLFLYDPATQPEPIRLGAHPHARRLGRGQVVVLNARRHALTMVDTALCLVEVVPLSAGSELCDGEHLRVKPTRRPTRPHFFGEHRRCKCVCLVGVRGAECVAL